MRKSTEYTGMRYALTQTGHKYHPDFNNRRVRVCMCEKKPRWMWNVGYRNVVRL